MESKTTPFIEVQQQKFASTEEELTYLRERMKQIEGASPLPEHEGRREKIIREEVVTYADAHPQDVLEENFIISAEESIRAALELAPEAHDAQIDGLLKIVSEKGVKNALSIAAQLKNPHLEDDFHRALVRYLALGLPVPGSGKPSSQVWDALTMTLFEVHPQGARGDSTEKRPLKDVVESMVQLYAGLISMVADSHRAFSLELSVPEGTEEAILFIAVPKEKANLFARLVLSVFPYASIKEQPQDYNPFVFGGVTAAAYATTVEHPSLPLKTYEAFEHDPMNVLLAAFAKLKKDGEAAAVQIMIGNDGDRYNKYYHKILNELNAGKKFKEAITVPETALGDFAHDIYGAMFKKDKDEMRNHQSDQPAIEGVGRKIETRIVPVSIKVVASAQDQARAQDILGNITSTFHQFDDPNGNRLQFESVSGWGIQRFVRAFTLRLWEHSYAIPLSLSELTTMYHLTAEAVSTSRELKQSHAKQIAAPVTMPEGGIILGMNTFGGNETPVLYGEQDRLRHFYCIGQTGTGKSTLLKNMIIQDIKNGEGVCFIDPHGNDIEHILASVPPEREKDVIYFDPAYTARPMGLNMMEYDLTKPEQKTFVVNELLSIFEKLYEKVPEALGPMFQQYFRNAAMLVVEDPSSGNTMVDISRVLADSAFRKLKLSRCNNPLVTQFWQSIAEKAEGEASLQNVVPYITSKTDTFLANDIMRPIVCQEKSSFDFRDIMDSKKIFLANLSKGRIGDINANLLGLVVVGKFLKAALSRVDSRENLPVFYLYIDEFQNFTTPSIATILSEARKYKLSLHVAHQFIKQLDERISDAIFGNVGSRCVFRVGDEDAEFLARGMQPDVTASDIVHLDNYNAYLAMLVEGKPAKPFNIQLIKPEDVDYHRVDELKEISYRTFGRDRAEVEGEISRKFAPSAPQPRTAADWYV